MADNPIPLLPCPWCGSENVANGTGDDDFDADCNYDGICCLDCYARGPLYHQCEASAIASWNKGPYADRFEIHAQALKNHADKLTAQAEALEAKAAQLRAKAATSEESSEVRSLKENS